MSAGAAMIHISLSSAEGKPLRRASMPVAAASVSRDEASVLTCVLASVLASVWLGSVLASVWLSSVSSSVASRAKPEFAAWRPTQRHLLLDT